MAFFASPAKSWLINRLKERNDPVLQRTASQESLNHPMMGLPNDPGQEFDDIVREVREEVEARRRRGSRKSDSFSFNQDVKAAVQERLGQSSGKY